MDSELQPQPRLSTMIAQNDDFLYDDVAVETGRNDNSILARKKRDLQRFFSSIRNINNNRGMHLG